MTEMEVVYIDNHVVLTITTGSVRGASTATLIHLTPAQRQQLIKALQPQALSAQGQQQSIHRHMSKPLTKRQITVLSIMAGKAYKRIQSQGCPLPSLTDWRHDEIWAATGVTESLTKATQEHYVPIYNRLASYLGEAPLKNRTWTEMDKAIHNLRDAMAAL